MWKVPRALRSSCEKRDGGEPACVATEKGNYRDGNYGAGCGATVGKALGPDYCMKAGIGSFAVKSGDLMVGAVVVVNALGDVVDPATGAVIAGLRSADGEGFRSTTDALAGAGGGPSQHGTAVTNTTIGAILTNALLPKALLCKVAGMAHDGLARAIRPVHLSMDGDSVYALSTCEVEASVDVVGALAAEVIAQAILVAARSADPAYGLPGAASMR